MTRSGTAAALLCVEDALTIVLLLLLACDVAEVCAAVLVRVVETEDVGDDGPVEPLTCCVDELVVAPLFPEAVDDDIAEVVLICVDKLVTAPALTCGTDRSVTAVVLVWDEEWLTTVVAVLALD